MAAATPGQHVLIIGAGPTGLAIAHGLTKANIAYTIFDADNGDLELRQKREWTMALHWSMPMLKSLLPDPLASRISSHGVADPSLDYEAYPNNITRAYDGVSGDVLKEFESKRWRVSRRKMRKLLLEGLNIQWSHRLSSITYEDDGQAVTATFSNGSSYTGTLLIGTDGAHSSTRQHIFGAENSKATPLNMVFSSNVYQFADTELAARIRQLIPVGAICAHPACNVLVNWQDVPDPAMPETWSFQASMWWKPEPDRENRDPALSNVDRQAEIKSKAEKMAEPFRSALLAIPEDMELQYHHLTYWIPPTDESEWSTHNGKIALAGDAAHPMPPHRGQGLNHSFNDAYNFVEALETIQSGANQRDVIQKYCQEVSERGGREVELSKQSAEVMSRYETFSQSAFVKQGFKKGE